MPRFSPVNSASARFDPATLKTPRPAPCDALPLDPHSDIQKTPRDGELCWLLALGLNREAVRRSRVSLRTANGVFIQDPGLQQAWSRSQFHYGRSGGPALPGASFETPCAEPARHPSPKPQAGARPAARPRPANRCPVLLPLPQAQGLTSIERMLTEVTVRHAALLLHDFFLRRGEGGEPSTREQKRLQLSALSHLLDIRLPPRRAAECAVPPDRIAALGTERVFGAPPDVIAHVIQLASSKARARLLRHPAADASQQDIRLAMQSFDRSIHTCLGRLARMGA